MSRLPREWVKPTLVITVVGVLAWHLPSTPVDPWHLLNLKKIATMVFALAFIQVLGSVMNRILGARTGSVLTGFFGGLVSSTATTASLARKSKIKDSVDSASEVLVFLSATGAMLVEGIVLVVAGATNAHLPLLFMFLGPLFVTVILLYLYSRKVADHHVPSEEIPFQILPILRLSIFIVTILLVSKGLQKFFGQNGLMVLTFLVSLFEIHGSVIVNVQLHENASVGTELLGNLLALSVFASYLSKLFLISVLGSKNLRTHAVRVTALLFLSLVLSWMTAQPLL